MAEQEFDLAAIVDLVRGLLWRRRWWIIGPTCGVTLLAIAVLLKIPNRYTSEATLLVVQQQVPERYVVPTTTTDINKALAGMQQEALSRSRLLSIIDELALYPKLKNYLAPEELIDRMRKDITIAPRQNNPEVREVNSFSISFVADTPELAQEVTSRLTTLIIEQNLKSRADQAATTTRFLSEQVEMAKAKLAEQEQRVKDFKLQNLGQLPEQQQGNIGILSGLQSQLQNVMTNLNRAQQQKSYLESMIGEYKRLGPKRVPVAGNSNEVLALTPLEMAEQKLSKLETDKQQLLLIYTPDHPDVLRKEKEIASQETVVASLKVKKAPTPTAKPAPVQMADADDSSETNPMVLQLRSQLESNRLEIENLTKAEQKLKADIAEYQRRLNLTPVREQQLTAMMRDYELSKKSYAELLNKKTESEMASNLEKRQEGQQFRLADPPNLPAVPSSPKRLKLSLMALAAGLCLGLALAVVLEFKIPVYYTDQEVIRGLGVPLVVGLPMVPTPAERRRQKITRFIECIACLLLFASVSLAEFYVFRFG